MKNSFQQTYKLFYNIYLTKNRIEVSYFVLLGQVSFFEGASLKSLLNFTNKVNINRNVNITATYYRSLLMLRTI